MKPLEFVKILTSGEKHRSIWTHGDGLDIYMRLGHHFVHGEMLTCLDIANVNATKPGKGAFTAFLNKVEEAVKNSDVCNCVFVESILEPRFVAYLQKRGYETTQNSVDLAPHLYKKFSKE